MKIRVKDGQFFADGFAVRSFELREGQTRLISYLSDKGCGCAALSLREGILLIDRGKIGVITWGKREAELFPLPCGRFTEVWEFPNNGAPIRVTHLSGAISQIRLSGRVRFGYEPICLITDLEVTPITNQREIILDLRACCEKGEYIALLSVGRTEAKVLLEGYGEEITCVGNEVTVRTSFPDLIGRQVTERYFWEGASFSCSREIVCSHHHALLREERGRGLLEAVLAKDGAEIERLLSPAIRDAQAIMEYFGEIVEIRPALFSDSPTAISVVKKQGDALLGMTYDFDLDREGLIENIRDLDEV